MAGRKEQWPSGIKLLCVHCDAPSLIAKDEAQEAVVPVRGFFNHKIEDTQVENAKPLGPMQGELGGNNQYEEAAIDAARAQSGSKCSSSASLEELETTPSIWPTQSRQLPCGFQSF